MLSLLWGAGPPAFTDAYALSIEYHGNIVKQEPYDPNYNLIYYP